jgi:hypothetical protein
MERIEPTLIDVLEQNSVKNLPFTEAEFDAINAWAASNQKLFASDNLNAKPHSPLEKAFGVVTFSYTKDREILQLHHESIQTMHTTIGQYAGELHQNKFKLSQLANFKLVSKVWMVLHGKLGFEFSLTNDNAREAAEVIAQFEPQSVELIRTELLKFYYLAIEQKPDSKSQTLLSKVTRYFKF